MDQQTYQAVMAMTDRMLTVAAAATEGYQERFDADAEPITSNHISLVRPHDGFTLTLPVGYYTSYGMGHAWNVVKNLQELVQHSEFGDLLMDHIATFLTGMLGVEPGDNADLAFTLMLSNLTPKILVQACIMGWVSWQADPEGF